MVKVKQTIRVKKFRWKMKKKHKHKKGRQLILSSSTVSDKIYKGCYCESPNCFHIIWNRNPYL